MYIWTESYFKSGVLFASRGNRIERQGKQGEPEALRTSPGSWEGLSESDRDTWSWAEQEGLGGTQDWYPGNTGTFPCSGAKREKKDSLGKGASETLASSEILSKCAPVPSFSSDDGLLLKSGYCLVSALLISRIQGHSWMKILSQTHLLSGDSK